MAKGSLKKQSLSTAPSSMPGKGGGKGVKDGSLAPASIKARAGREHSDKSLAPSSLGGRAARVLGGRGY